MDHLVVVPHPVPISLEARSLRTGTVPDGAVGLGYYHDGRLIARGVVAAGALDTIRSLLSEPVSVALAAREDDDGNIDGRICLVLPVDPDADEEAGAHPEPTLAHSLAGDLPINLFQVYGEIHSLLTERIRSSVELAYNGDFVSTLKPVSLIVESVSKGQHFSFP